MSTSSTAKKIRVGLQLCTSVPMEAMVVLRLQQLAKPRRNDWLRSLVVRGFVNECEALRQLNGEPVTRDMPTSAKSPSAVVTPLRADPTEPKEHPTTSTDSPLTLSALKAVVA